MATLTNIRHRAEVKRDEEDITKLVDAFGHVGIVRGGGHYVNSIVHDYLDAIERPVARHLDPSTFDPDSWIGGQGIIRAGGRFCIYDDATLESIKAIPSREAKTVIWAPIVTEAMSREEIHHLDDVRDSGVMKVGDDNTRRIFRLDMCQTPLLAMYVMRMDKFDAVAVSQPVVCLMY